MTTILHPDRYNICYSSQIKKLGVVVHDSESGDGSFTSLVNALRSPGDRWSDPNDHSKGKYGSGYHAITNGVGGYLRIADPWCGPFSAPPLNYTWAHVCMPGRASQTREEWLDTLSRNHIRGVAEFIVDQWNMDDQSWQLGFIFADRLKLGAKGYTSHYQVSLAWRKTTHTDPGGNFPWDVLLADVHDLAYPSPPPIPPQPPTTQKEEEMFTVRVQNYKASFLRTNNGDLIWIQAADASSMFAKYGDPVIVATWSDLYRLGKILGENPGEQ